MGEAKRHQVLGLPPRKRLLDSRIDEVECTFPSVSNDYYDGKFVLDSVRQIYKTYPNLPVNKVLEQDQQRYFAWMVAGKLAKGMGSHEISDAAVTTFLSEPSLPVMTFNPYWVEKLSNGFFISGAKTLPVPFCGSGLILFPKKNALQIAAAFFVTTYEAERDGNLTGRAGVACCCLTFDKGVRTSVVIPCSMRDKSARLDITKYTTKKDRLFNTLFGLFVLLEPREGRTIHICENPLNPVPNPIQILNTFQCTN